MSFEMAPNNSEFNFEQIFLKPFEFSDKTFFQYDRPGFKFFR